MIVYLKTIVTQARSIHIKLVINILLSACLATSFNSASATIRYVKAGASGAGTSWSDASGDMQAMINASISGDMVWVAGGIYTPIRRADNLTVLTLGDRNNAFVMTLGVAIYGGFAGTESSLSARNLTLTANASILSGDLNKDDIGFTNNDENAYHVVISPGNVGAAVLDGFTIQGGNCNGSVAVSIGSESIGQNGGGGIFCSTSSPTLNNLWVKGNAGRYGAGAVFSTSSSFITRTRFSGNAGYYGGAILCSSANAAFTNVLISGNTAVEQGGGMYNQFGTVAPVLTNVTISGNTAGNAGGAMYNDLGASLLVNNSIIYGNNSGIYNNNGTPAIQYSLVQGLTGATGNNISGVTDPLFNSPVAAGLSTSGDYGLQPCSPVVDKGSNSYYASGQSPDLSGITTDLAGNSRFYNSGTVDMGAFERGGVTVAPAAGGIIYVKGGGTGTGTSWACATTDLQAAINTASSGNMVWVAGGTYQRGGSGEYFRMKEGVKIYGGFAGTETALSQRDLSIAANTSTLQGTNTSVFFNTSLTTAALLDGFTITGGSNADYGGGMFNYYASPTISHCIFSANNATYGGGMYNQSGSPVISYCTFTGNNSTDEGGGVENYQASAVFTNCTFTNNTCSNFDGGGFGGGVYDHNSSSNFINCTVGGNIADYAGGILILNDDIPSGMLTGCIITGNLAILSGGGGLTIRSTSVYVSNCTIAGNQGQETFGGGIYYFFFYTTPLVSTLQNCIVYGNSSGTGCEGCNYNNPNGSDFQDTYNSLVQGLSATANGNLAGNTDPRFVSPMAYSSAPTTSGDYHLQDCSPTINAGSNMVYNVGQTPDLSGIITDLDGLTRIQGAAVDMGAYEFSGGNSGNPIPVDMLAINGDVAAVSISGPTTLTATASVCRMLATVQPDGSGTSISGSVNGKVWIGSAQPATYVKRHYQITPSAGNATGRVTLYFTQAEFDAFNAVNVQKLPTGPGDATGIANLLVEERPGSSSDGSGLPGSYTGTPLTINPADADIVFNSSAARWEVSFAATGFGGFFIKTQLTPLPLQLLSFNGSGQSGYNLLQWTTTQEINTKYFELESHTGQGSFTTIATIDAVGNGSGIYSYRDTKNYNATNVYYRLKMVDRDGHFTYSQTISLGSNDNVTVTVYPNPATDVLYISTGNSLLQSNAALYDASGRLLQNILITTSSQPINVRQLNSGLYFLKLADGSVGKFIKK